MAKIEMSSPETKSSVQVIERAARILRALADHPEDGLSLSAIAARVGLARSTVHRLVSALETEAFVVAASPNGRVKLGPGLASLAVSAAPDLAREVHPFLARLSREIHETVDLGVLQHDHVLFVDQVAAPRRLRAVSAVGAAFPAHCPANGPRTRSPTGLSSSPSFSGCVGTGSPTTERSTPSASADWAAWCVTETAGSRPSPFRCPLNASTATRSGWRRCCCGRARRSRRLCREPHDCGNRLKRRDPPCRSLARLSRSAGTATHRAARARFHENGPGEWTTGDPRKPVQLQGLSGLR